MNRQIPLKWHTQKTYLPLIPLKKSDPLHFISLNYSHRLHNSQRHSEQRLLYSLSHSVTLHYNLSEDLLYQKWTSVTHTHHTHSPTQVVRIASWIQISQGIERAEEWSTLKKERQTASCGEKVQKRKKDESERSDTYLQWWPTHECKTLKQSGLH